MSRVTFSECPAEAYISRSVTRCTVPLPLAFTTPRAFVCAPEANPNMYMQLPRLPPELQGANLGRGAGSEFVAHMHRSSYGPKQAGRVWQQHLMKWMIETLGARLYVTDRCVFEWEWQGHKMRGGISR